MAWSDTETPIKKSSISENWLFDFYNQDSYLSFDGTNDYIDLGATTASSTLSLTSTEDLSVAMWVNFPVEDASEWIFLNNTVDSGYSGFAIYRDSGNKFSIVMGDGSGVLAGDYRRFRTSTTYSANTWYHVVVTTGFANNGSDTTWYVNGSTSGISTEVAGSESSITTPSYASGNAYFGRQAAPHPDSYGQFKIRSLGIWSGILNANDVTAIYNGGKYHNLAKASGNYASADVDKLKAYWQFNNAQVATDFINDVSGKIHGATYNGSGLHLAFKDTSYDNNFYHGVIKNKPSIRESINLSNSTSSRSNLSVDIPDFKYKGSPISEELFGSNVYMNHDVRVYSQIDADTPELIGSYRLSDISTSGDSLQLSLKTFHPWDHISFPQNKHTQYGVYEPVAYGDFDHSEADSGAVNDAVYGGVFPVPILYTNRNIFTCVYPRSYSSGSDSYLHHYVGFNWFCSLRDETGSDVVDETTTDGGVNVMETPISHRAVGYIKSANSSYQAGGGSVTYLTNPENAFTYSTFDGSADTTTYSTGDIDNTLDIRYLVLQTPKKKFAVTIINAVKLKYSIMWDSGSGDPQEYDIDFFSNEYHSSNDDLLSSPTTKQLSNSISTHDFQFSASPANAVASEVAAVCPDEILIKFDPQHTPTPYDHEDHELRVYDVQMEYENRFNYNEDDAKRLSDMKYFYCGGAGLAHGITGLSSAITEIHEAHLDLMNRFAGLDVSTNPATNIEGWGNGSDNLLDHVKDWKIRYWELEPTSLTKALEKLQYEGGFIFTFRRGDFTQPEYIFIRDTYSAVDFADINKYDLSDVQIKPDSFSSVVTKMNINYQKHPAESGHITLKNCENNSAKAEYVINSKENKKEVKLDAYVSPEIPAVPASNPNDDFYTYYNNINGEVKLNISGTFVNPKYYSINVGNTVTFSDSLMYPEKAYGKAFTKVIFMITSITRSVGSIKFSAREIGSLP